MCPWIFARDLPHHGFSPPLSDLTMDFCMGVEQFLHIMGNDKPPPLVWGIRFPLVFWDAKNGELGS